MNKDYSQHIDDFNVYLLQKLNSIAQISGSDHHLLKKVLYVSFLDSLSVCVCSDKGNKKRFMYLLDKYSNWNERDNVSLTHLSRIFSLSSDPIPPTIYNFVDEKLKGWKDQPHKIILISEDPTSIEVKKLGWTNGKIGSKIIYLSDIKHSNLLYQLRNSLVHQLQTKNEFGNNIPDVPFYQVVSKLEQDGTSTPLRIELLYPSKFLETLSKTVLNNVIQYLKKGNINPFPHYYAGDYWLEKLN